MADPVADVVAVIVVIVVVLLMSHGKLDLVFPVSGVLVPITFLLAGGRAMKACAEKKISGQEVLLYGVFISMIIFVASFLIIPLIVPKL